MARAIIVWTNDAARSTVTSRRDEGARPSRLDWDGSHVFRLERHVFTCFPRR